MNNYHVCFITLGSIREHATLKRATGMAEPLMAKGYRVSILIEKTADNLERIQLECPNVETHFLESKSALHDMRQRQRIVNKIQPDCVWVCGLGLRNWVTRVRGKKDTIIIADHSELFSAIPDRSKIRRSYDYTLEYMCAFFFQEHFVASRYLERVYIKKLKKIGRRQKPLYFPYAFNRKVLEADTHPLLESLREKYVGQKLIVYLGTFSENYGIFDMIRTAASLKQSRSDFKFVLIGHGKEKGRAVAMVEELRLQDQVEFPGYVPESEISSYLAVASVFLCPLRDTVQDWARCPSKLFMFLPYRKPIVSCRIGEAIELLGESGFYYIPGDIVSMTKVLICAMDAGSEVRFPNPCEHDWDARVATFEAWLNTRRK